jgi:sulfatase maturation enzyme AslB (radical SAM superfamily)
MNKTLVIGNETQNTDDTVTALASEFGSTNHGLITDSNFVPVSNGYYHTTVVDLSPGNIANLAKHFDTVMMLDQEPESYPHFKSLVTTVRLMHDLELSGINTIYKNNVAAKKVLYWRNFLEKNKSFCFYPFAALINDREFAHICEKNHQPLAKINNIVEWKTNSKFNDIRNKMVNGTLIPEYCDSCYKVEKIGQESMRQFETLEWANRIGAASVDDFVNIKNPLYYEIRPSNKCNIMCRTCDNQHSHLIEKEYKKIGIPLAANGKYQNTPFDQIDFESVRTIYVGGGEPTIISEFYDFLQKCISVGRTDFELNIGTNGLKFSDKIIKLLDHFSDVCFSVSFDGYKKINDYIRWRSDFDTIVNNTHMLQDRGHKIGLQTVFSMYNLTRIHEIFEFYDREFPGCSSLVNFGDGPNHFEPNNHPCPDLVVESMKRCQQTNVYYANGRSLKSMVDLTLKHYSDPDYKVNVDHLRHFYNFNAKLDQSRGSRLVDYIPELEEGCKFYLPI